MLANRISEQAKDYLNYKRNLGFLLKNYESVLMGFVNYTLMQEYNGPLTREIVFQWLATFPAAKDKTLGRKIEAIRPFSKYVASFDGEAEAIYDRIFRNVHDRPAPYIYTEDEVILLMKECESLYSPDQIRAKTTAAVIGLLWSCGLRPSEPVSLQYKDVDLKNGILHIRDTKFSKERYIPLDSSVTQKLAEYLSWIESILGSRHPDDPFFYTTGGKPLTWNSLHYAFKLIRSCIDAQTKGYPYVRLYDFRHTMACNTIKRWAENGMDVNEKLYILSTYMGHVHPEDTFWYLSATPEMLSLSCSKYEDMFGGGHYEE